MGGSVLLRVALNYRFFKSLVEYLAVIVFFLSGPSSVLAGTVPSASRPSIRISEADFSRLSASVYSKVPEFIHLSRSIDRPDVRVGVFGGTARNILMYIQTQVDRLGSVQAFEQSLASRSSIPLFDIHAPTSDLDVIVIPQGNVEQAIVDEATSAVSVTLGHSPFFDHPDVQSLSMATSVMTQYPGWEAVSNIIINTDGVVAPSSLNVDIGGGLTKNLSLWGLEQFSKGVFDFRVRSGISAAVDKSFQQTLRFIRFITEIPWMQVSDTSKQSILDLVRSWNSTPERSAEFTRLVGELSDTGSASGAIKRLQGAQFNSRNLVQTRQNLKDFGVEDAIKNVSSSAVTMRFFEPVRPRPQGTVVDPARRLGRELKVYHNTSDLGAARSISFGAVIKSNEGNAISIKVGNVIQNRMMVAAFGTGFYTMQTANGRPHASYGDYPVEVSLSPDATFATYEEIEADPSLRSKVDLIAVTQTQNGIPTGEIIWVVQNIEAFAKNPDGSLKVTFDLNMFKQSLMFSLDEAAAGRLTLTHNDLLRVVSGLAVLVDPNSGSVESLKIIDNLNRIEVSSRYGDLYQLFGFKRLMTSISITPAQVEKSVRSIEQNWSVWKATPEIAGEINSLISRLSQISNFLQMGALQNGWSWNQSLEMFSRLANIDVRFAEEMAKKVTYAVQSMSEANYLANEAEIKRFFNGAEASALKVGEQLYVRILEQIALISHSNFKLFNESFASFVRGPDIIRFVKAQTNSLNQNSGFLLYLMRIISGGIHGSVGLLGPDIMNALKNGNIFFQKQVLHELSNGTGNIIVNAPPEFIDAIAGFARDFYANPLRNVNDSNLGFCERISEKLSELSLNQVRFDFISMLIRKGEFQEVLELRSFFRNPYRTIESPDLIASFANRIASDLRSPPPGYSDVNFIKESIEYSLKDLFRDLDKIYLPGETASSRSVATVERFRSFIKSITPLLGLPIDVSGFSTYLDDLVNESELKPLADALKMTRPEERMEFLRAGSNEVSFLSALNTMRDEADLFIEGRTATNQAIAIDAGKYTKLNSDLTAAQTPKAVEAQQRLASLIDELKLKTTQGSLKPMLAEAFKLMVESNVHLIYTDMAPLLGQNDIKIYGQLRSPSEGLSGRWEIEVGRGDSLIFGRKNSFEIIAHEVMHFRDIALGLLPPGATDEASPFRLFAEVNANLGLNTLDDAIRIAESTYGPIISSIRTKFSAWNNWTPAQRYQFLVDISLGQIEIAKLTSAQAAKITTAINQTGEANGLFNLDRYQSATKARGLLDFRVSDGITRPTSTDPNLDVKSLGLPTVSGSVRNIRSGGTSEFFVVNTAGRLTDVKVINNSQGQASGIAQARALQEFFGARVLGEVAIWIKDPATGENVLRRGVQFEHVDGISLGELLRLRAEGLTVPQVLNDLHLAALESLQAKLSSAGKSLANLDPSDVVFTSDGRIVVYDANLTTKTTALNGLFDPVTGNSISSLLKNLRDANIPLVPVSLPIGAEGSLLQYLNRDSYDLAHLSDGEILRAVRAKIESSGLSDLPPGLQIQSRYQFKQMFSLDRALTSLERNALSYLLQPDVKISYHPTDTNFHGHSVYPNNGIYEVRFSGSLGVLIEEAFHGVTLRPRFAPAAQTYFSKALFESISAKQHTYTEMMFEWQAKFARVYREGMTEHAALQEAYELLIEEHPELSFEKIFGPYYRGTGTDLTTSQKFHLGLNLLKLSPDLTTDLAQHGSLLTNVFIQAKSVTSGSYTDDTSLSDVPTELRKRAVFERITDQVNHVVWTGDESLSSSEVYVARAVNRDEFTRTISSGSNSVRASQNLTVSVGGTSQAAILDLANTMNRGNGSFLVIAKVNGSNLSSINSFGANTAILKGAVTWSQVAGVGMLPNTRTPFEFADDFKYAVDQVTRNGGEIKTGAQVFLNQVNSIMDLAPKTGVYVNSVGQSFFDPNAVSGQLRQLYISKGFEGSRVVPPQAQTPTFQSVSVSQWDSAKNTWVISMYDQIPIESRTDDFIKTIGTSNTAPSTTIYVNGLHPASTLAQPFQGIKSQVMNSQTFQGLLTNVGVNGASVYLNAAMNNYSAQSILYSSGVPISTTAGVVLPRINTDQWTLSKDVSLKQINVQLDSYSSAATLGASAKLDFQYHSNLRFATDGHINTTTSIINSALPLSGSSLNGLATIANHMASPVLEYIGESAFQGLLLNAWNSPDNEFHLGQAFRDTVSTLFDPWNLAFTAGMETVFSSSLLGRFAIAGPLGAALAGGALFYSSPDLYQQAYTADLKPGSFASYQRDFWLGNGADTSYFATGAEKLTSDNIKGMAMMTAFFGFSAGLQGLSSNFMSAETKADAFDGFQKILTKWTPDPTAVLLRTGGIIYHQEEAQKAEALLHKINYYESLGVSTPVVLKIAQLSELPDGERASLYQSILKDPAYPSHGAWGSSLTLSPGSSPELTMMQVGKDTSLEMAKLIVDKQKSDKDLSKTLDSLINILGEFPIIEGVRSNFDKDTAMKYLSSNWELKRDFISRMDEAGVGLPSFTTMLELDSSGRAAGTLAIISDAKTERYNPDLTQSQNQVLTVDLINRILGSDSPIDIREDTPMIGAMIFNGNASSSDTLNAIINGARTFADVGKYDEALACASLIDSCSNSGLVHPDLKKYTEYEGVKSQEKYSEYMGQFSAAVGSAMGNTKKLIEMLDERLDKLIKKLFKHTEKLNKRISKLNKWLNKQTRYLLELEFQRQACETAYKANIEYVGEVWSTPELNKPSVVIEEGKTIDHNEEDGPPKECKKIPEAEKKLEKANEKIAKHSSKLSQKQAKISAINSEIQTTAKMKSDAQQLKYEYGDQMSYSEQRKFEESLEDHSHRYRLAQLDSVLRKNEGILNANEATARRDELRLSQERLTQNLITNRLCLSRSLCEQRYPELFEDPYDDDYLRD